MALAPPPETTKPAVVAPADTPTTSGLATLIVGVLVVAALYLGSDVLIPIVLAILLSFVLAPVASFLRRLRLGRIPSVILAVVLALAIILALAGVIAVQVASVATDLGRYQTTIEQKVGDLREGTIGRVAQYLSRFGRQIEQAAEEAAQTAAEEAGAAAEEMPAPAAPAAPQEREPIPVEVHQPDPSSFEVAQRVIGPLLSPLATLGIVLVVTVFLLLQREDLRDRLIRLFGSSDLHRTTFAMSDAAKRLSRYFLMQVMLATLYGIVIGTCLWLIGVPAPVLWGILAALMRFVPYVGSIIAALPPVVMAAAVDPGWSMVLMTLALFVVGEAAQGNVIEPQVFGRSTGLSPFAVIVAAIFWTWLWGPIGLILATPLTVCLVVLGRHVERLEFLDVILGDRPALTPTENFYQRMLAGDPDEAHEHAELLLKERSLTSYYDEVALKGLQLAANDARRGVLTPKQVERVKTLIEEMVEDLDGHEDIDPASVAATPAEDPAGLRNDERPIDPNAAGIPLRPDELSPEWRSENAILCVAGRGPLDEAASAMLAQLLRKHGLGARAVPHEAVSRTNIIGFDVTGVAMVSISYLEISGNPAHLRYLLKRLRQKLPDAPLLVGMWPAEDAILTDEALRTRLGADVYVTSLREAVEACVEAARRGAGPTASREEEARRPSPEETGAEASLPDRLLPASA